jgi:hypothetical protein
LQATSGVVSGRATAPDEFYDVYTTDLEAEGHATSAAGSRRSRRRRCDDRIFSVADV